MMLAIFVALLAPSATAQPAPSLDRMNVYQPRAHCVPVQQQVARGERRNGTRLDHQPEGRALLAVERQVDGCREVTFVGERRGAVLRSAPLDPGLRRETRN